MTWTGLALSYYNDYPIGFHITTLAFGAYVVAQAGPAAGSSLGSDGVADVTPLVAVTTPLGGLSEMLSHPFMRHAFISGTAIAVPAGLASYFIVLRRQVLPSDALGHVAFTGALAALAFGSRSAARAVCGDCDGALAARRARDARALTMS